MHGTGRRFVWAEDLPASVLSDVSVLGMLQRRGLGLVTSVRPQALESSASLIALLRGCHDRGISISLWPMLDDEDGRWLSAHNTAKFLAMSDGLVDLVVREGPLPTGMVFDLEPPITVVRELVTGRLGHLTKPITAQTESLRAALGRVRQAGILPWATVVPTVLFDTPARPGWQKLLGTPVDGLPFASVSPMIYTSLLQGYSRGLLRREDARAWLYASARRCVQRFGPRASVSLGAVGLGALGDEQTYASPTELAEDVDTALSAGIDDLAVFDLRGILDRGPPERWLDAICRPRPPTTPPGLRSWRGAALDAFGIGISHLARLRR